ncbi:DUF4167 domain-containing protein [uncultured Aliiroseovarius sp.]|uniref:DUF4167 domain-containing protein n=1 Tax=uncultured Aliiroseovarius sp. TaxID=1658783 RepID=UPI0026072791|nr:DUF4167 domain-containing protein [uncultured Aliiroseovarius sp.]
MRSSKSRSRNKSNRNRNNPGNNINRVFDSSGPEGKVRGTPQQIIEKYTQLARDAFLSNDRVAAENFQQHAEHYTRLLGEAQREMEARRVQTEQQNRERQQREKEDREARPDNKPTPDVAGEGEQPNVSAPSQSDVSNDADSGLVETPESKSKKAPTRARKPRKPVKRSPDQGEASSGSAPAAPDDAPKAAE